MSNWLKNAHSAMADIRAVSNDLIFYGDAFKATGNSEMAESLHAMATDLFIAEKAIGRALSENIHEQHKSAMDGTAQMLKFALEVPKFVDKIKEDARQEMENENG